MGMLHDNEPGQADEPPILRGDAPPGMFTPRWEELRETYGIDRPRANTKCNYHSQAASGLWDPSYAAVGQSGGHA